MKGILADVNATGPIEALVQEMQAEPWSEFWNGLGLISRRFDEVGLLPTSTDLEVWQVCQREQLVLITNNRNHKAPDSLEATIREHAGPGTLPVFTIGDLYKFRTSRSYADRVLETLYDYLYRIDDVRGAGRLYLP